MMSPKMEHPNAFVCGMLSWAATRNSPLEQWILIFLAIGSWDVVPTKNVFPGPWPDLLLTPGHP